MTNDEIIRKIGPIRYASLQNEAAYLTTSYNSSPGVDQGGQYVYTTYGWELQKLLDKEIKKIMSI